MDHWRSRVRGFGFKQPCNSRVSGSSFDMLPTPLTLSHRHRILLICPARPRWIFSLHTLHTKTCCQPLLVPCTIANPFQAIKQTSFSRKAEAFTAENVEHAESKMGILMLYLSNLCVLCGKMQTLVSDLCFWCFFAEE